MNFDHNGAKPGSISTVESLLDGGHIERYHVKGKRMLTRQNVAEHSWRMVAILFAIWPTARPQLFLAAAFHDVSERVTGDVPSPVKWFNPEVQAALNELTTNEENRLGIRFELLPDEERLLGWVDRFEGAMHCMQELLMGNRLIIPTLRRYTDAADKPGFVLHDLELEKVRQHMLTDLKLKVGVLIERE